MKGTRRLLVRAALRLGRLTRGVTLGVRGMLLKEGAVLLVRHTYVPGWYLPGGGLDPGETALDAMLREAREEAGVAFLAPPRLFGLYRNAALDPRDHVAFFVGRDWARDESAFRPNREIRDCALFPLDRLPEGTTPATRARLAEVLEGAPPSPDW